MTKEEKLAIYRTRFQGRTDVFGKKWTTQDKKRSGYMPVCINHFTDVCLLNNKEGRCSECEHKQYTELSDEWLWKHISGTEQLIIYLLDQEGKVKFAAIDIDFKAPPIPEPEAKLSEHLSPEEKQTVTERIHNDWVDLIKRLTPTFKDVVLLRQTAARYGIPVHIARSTSKGYHLYFFFDKFIEAKYATSFIIHLYEVCGFYEENKEGKLLPEIFPKQITFQNDRQIGNGIKTPLIEPQIEIGRNCFVDDNDIIYTEQWQYLTEAAEIDTEKFKQLLKDKEIRIWETAAGNTAGMNRERNGNEKHNEPWREPASGDFRKIVRMCPAANEYWKMPAPKITHLARVWLLANAIHTKDGIGIIRKTWLSDQTEDQIRYACSTNQQPWTCKTIQQHGFCVQGRHPKFGDHCLKKRPPTEVVGGQILINPHNIPDTDWPDPSPFRLAFSKETDAQVKKYLYEQLDKLAAAPPSNLIEEIYGILKQTEDFEEINRNDLLNYIRRVFKKSVGQREIKSIVDQIEKEKKKENKENNRDNAIRDVNNRRYTIQNGCYCFVQTTLSGEQKIVPFTNFIIIHERDVIIRTNINAVEITERRAQGSIQVEGKKFPFNIDQNRWASPVEMLRTLFVATGSQALIDRNSMDHLYCCIKLFNQAKEEIHYKEFGWAKNMYLSPSVIVDCDGVHTNDRMKIVLSESGIAAGLDFKKVSTTKLKDILTIVKKYLLPYGDHKMTYTTISHTLGAAVLKLYPFENSPILWLTGNTGTGKSYFLKIVQHFYGTFPAIINTSTTPKSAEQYGSQFKDALFCIDDFKEVTQKDITGFMQLMQNTYDRNLRGLLNKDSTQREARQVRGFLGVSGEDFVGRDAAAVARTIIVTVDKEFEPDGGKIAYENREDYSAITPDFIFYMLQHSRTELANRFNEVAARLKATVLGINQDRISQNLAYNYVVFEQFVQYLARRDVASLPEVEAYCKEHWDIVTLLGKQLSAKCKSDTVGEQFIESLSSILMSQNCGIQGIPAHAARKFIIGYFLPEVNKEVFFINPGAVMGAIKRELTKPLLASREHIERQLNSMGYLVPSSKGNSLHFVRVAGGVRQRAWAIRLDKLGFDGLDIDFKEGEN